MDILQQVFQFSFRDSEEFRFTKPQNTFGDILKKMFDEIDRRINEVQLIPFYPRGLNLAPFFFRKLNLHDYMDATIWKEAAYLR